VFPIRLCFPRCLTGPRFPFVKTTSGSSISSARFTKRESRHQASAATIHSSTYHHPIKIVSDLNGSLGQHASSPTRSRIRRERSILGPTSTKRISVRSHMIHLEVRSRGCPPLLRPSIIKTEDDNGQLRPSELGFQALSSEVVKLLKNAHFAHVWVAASSWKVRVCPG